MSAHASVLSPRILAFDVMRETRTFDEPSFRASAAHVAADAPEPAGNPEQQVTAYFQEHAPAVYRYLAGVYGDEETAEDVTNEAFLRLYQALHDGISIENPRAWTLTVARRLMLTELRRAQSELARYQKLARSTPSPVLRPDELLCKRRRNEALVRELISLTPLERTCLKLSARGLKPSEIGELVGHDRRRVAEMVMRVTHQLAKKINE